ncbi:MAG: ABC transporter substrate-binding protein [Euryarchaeota archaeon]|nr:ABC transporter substrate-binding protein [Euryarchaeota archaeon]
MKINIILVRITISLLLALALPAAASDYTLGVFGNANEDDTINMQDVTYTELIILEYRDRTELSDAKYDGKINMQDVTQIELVILGKEKELTLLDTADRIVTVPQPIERVVAAGLLDDVRIVIQLGAADKLVGVNNYAKRYALKPSDYWSPIREAAPELKDLPDVGGYTNPNTEIILSLKPDVVFEYGRIPDVANAIQENTGIPVVCVSNSQLDLGVYRIAGMILGEEERAEELISYADEEIDKVTDITSDISEDEKPRVYCISGCGGESAITKTWGRYDPINIAGGVNVAEEHVVGSGSSIVSKEQIIAWNPDIILIHGVSPPHSISIETVLADPDLQTVNAVKNRNVNYTKGYMIGWDPATGLTECFYMAKLFHPDEFEDLNEEEEGNEILGTFYGVEDLYTGMLDLSDRFRWE